MPVYYEIGIMVNGGKYPPVKAVGQFESEEKAQEIHDDFFFNHLHVVNAWLAEHYPGRYVDDCIEFTRRLDQPKKVDIIFQ